MSDPTATMSEPTFADLTEQIQVKLDEISKLVAARRIVFDGCDHGICTTKINPEYCKGGAVCTSGIG